VPANKPVILVVDDDHKILRLLRIELTAQGFQVIMAERGQDALELKCYGDCARCPPRR
jgi:DNA-binding response OmpR family regulator